MKQILSLHSNPHTIKIYIPDMSNKENMFHAYPPAYLDRFDVATVSYNDIDLINDTLDEIFTRLIHVFNKFLKKSLPLPINGQAHELGKNFNYDSYDNQNRGFYQKYWLFSEMILQTWAYTIDNQICFEISPIYPWLFKEPKPGEEFVPFETYMENYKPYAFFSISKDTAFQWMNQCIPLARQLNIDIPQEAQS